MQTQINRTPKDNDSDQNSPINQPYVKDRTADIEKAKAAVKAAKTEQKKKKSSGCGCW